MVINIIKLSVGAEIPNKKAHRIIGLGKLAIRPNLARMIGQQMTIRPSHIGVGDNHVGYDHLARRQANAGCTIVFNDDFRHFSVAPHSTALTFDQATQPLHELASSTDGVVDAELAFEM